MKVCRNCNKEFDETEEKCLKHSQDLGNLFAGNDYCRSCEEELWMLNVFSSIEG